MRTSFRQAIVMVLVAPILFFVLLEGGLYLFGVDTVLRTEDPFVGFAGNVPLFEERRAPNGNTILATADNKLHLFNQQMFVKEKAADTYRIFCLGGSTTYGRPYNDTTSFAGWLRELLPAVDGRRDWEVINVGGISYASYRVTRLMEDLIQYQPDLFIIYTGQNEFLEERTYRQLRKVPEVVRSTVGLLAQTRTWTALNSALGRAGIVPEHTQPEQVKLAAEVDTILDHSTGPKAYQRDDALQVGVLEHFESGLHRMAEIAREAGAKVIFVTPASNLKDCSPFKSEHTDGLIINQQQESKQLHAEALIHMQGRNWVSALDVLNRAVKLDPRYAELHFTRGRALLALKRFDEAKAAFQRARDEDVCPLRSLTPMPRTVADVARKEGVACVDFVDLVEKATLARTGHSIPGREYFLDHVHPTVEAHKILATALVEEMIRHDIVQPGQKWNAATIAKVNASVKSRIDPHMQAQALINLSKVLHWAGKFEEARRLAEQGIAAAQGNGQLISQATNILIKIAKLKGDFDLAGQYIRRGLAADPGSPIMHYHLGLRLLQQERRQEGAAHILFAAAFWDANQTNSVLGMILYKNGRLDLAYPLFKKALRQDAEDRITLLAINDLQKRADLKPQDIPLVKTEVTRYPSGAPEKISLATGNGVADGMVTTWHENGNPKHYIEYANGMRHGIEMRWDQNGKIQYTAHFEHGIRHGG